jgi:hypothetical protein
VDILPETGYACILQEILVMNNGPSANQQNDESLEEYFEEDFDLEACFDDDEIDEEESELDEELPVFDAMEDDFEPPPDNDNDPLDDPLVWTLLIDV